jgi:hypothetical protein
MHDEMQSGRPPMDFLYIRILALLDEPPFNSADSIAQFLGVSHSTILSYSLELLGLKIFHLPWIPHELTTNLQEIRMETCRELLPILKIHEKKTFQRFVSGGKS